MMAKKNGNESLVEYLRFIEILHTQSVIDAFYAIDRKDFVPISYHYCAYENEPLPIGYHQTISQPQVVAFMLELLDAKKDNEVLDIGSGSGYTTAILSNIVGEKGKVIGLERIRELVEFGQKNLQKYNLDNAMIMSAKKELGIPNRTFDRILVSASCEVLPQELLSQLKIGGKLVIPIQHSIFLIEKLHDGIIKKEYKGFVFVPLIV